MASTDDAVAGPPLADDTFFFEEVEIDDDLDEGPGRYEEVPEVLSDDSDDREFDLRRAINSVKIDRAGATAAAGAVPRGAPSPDAAAAEGPRSPVASEAVGSAPQHALGKGPSAGAPVIDDFFRNFLLQHQFHSTLATFQAEYYEKSASISGAGPGVIPDVYRENQVLGAQLDQLRSDLQKAREQARSAKAVWDRLKKERDFHRLHHRRVVQEKNKLADDMKRLRAHYSTFKPTIKLLKEKYENTMKEKMMMKIERDKLLAQIDALQSQVKLLEGTDDSPAAIGAGAGRSGNPVESPSSVTRSQRSIPGAGAHHQQQQQRQQHEPAQRHTDTPYPPDRLPNPYADAHIEPGSIHKFGLQKTFKGHSMAVTDVASHPRKPVIATVSDDRSWKLWSVPSGDLIMSGEGHRDWIGACDMHPTGSLLATASADGTVKIWDFVDASCRVTLSDHSQVVWGCAFHSQGDFLVSCSTDHTAKAWDLATHRCRHTFRGHVDSVNAVQFQPFTSTFATASGDKTVSLWDLRSGLCTQTFFGHRNAVNHVTFNLGGTVVASCDADGLVKLWDTRTISQVLEIGPATPGTATSQTVFDRSGASIVAASDDGQVRVYDTTDALLQGTLAGHEDAVQCVALDATGALLISGASDCTFRVWSL